MDRLDDVPVMVDFPQAWLDKALSITGEFEGSGFDNVTGNFDGQGISCGILQWNAGQGSLQTKLLKKFIELHGSIDKLNIFPEKIMDTLATSNTEAGLRLVAHHMLSGVHVIDEWNHAWKIFLTIPGMIEVQKIACEDVASKAMKHCREWEMVSPRAFCWFFDLITQNGGLKGVKKPTVDRNRLVNACALASPKNASLWLSLKLSDEQIILIIASWQRSMMARAAYMKDVMDRKGTIAAGVGYVHGKNYDVSFK